MRKLFSALPFLLALGACQPAYAQDAACTKADAFLKDVAAASAPNDWKYVIETTGAEAHDALARMTAIAGAPLEGTSVSVISAEGYQYGRVVIFDAAGCVAGSGLLPMRLVQQAFGAAG